MVTFLLLKNLYESLPQKGEKPQNLAIFNSSKMDVQVTVTSEKPFSISLMKKSYTLNYCGDLTKKCSHKNGQESKGLRDLILTCHLVVIFVL